MRPILLILPPRLAAMVRRVARGRTTSPTRTQRVGGRKVALPALGVGTARHRRCGVARSGARHRAEGGGRDGTWVSVAFRTLRARPIVITRQPVWVVEVLVGVAIGANDRQTPVADLPVTDPRLQAR